MKKRFLMFMALALISAMILSLSACTDPDQPGTDEPDTAQPQTSVDTSENNVDTGEPATGEYVEPMYDGRKVSIQTVVQTDFIFPELSSLAYYNGYFIFVMHPNQAKELYGDKYGADACWFILDENGETVLDHPIYARVLSQFDENGLAVVEDYMLEDDRYVEINISGEVTREIDREEFLERYYSHNIDSSLYSVGWSVEMAGLDEYGRPNEYADFYWFDRNGKEMFGGQIVDGVTLFEDGIAVFEQDGKIGLVSDYGDILVPASVEGHQYPNRPLVLHDGLIVTSYAKNDGSYMAIYRVVSE